MRSPAHGIQPALHASRGVRLPAILLLGPFVTGFGRLPERAAAPSLGTWSATGAGLEAMPYGMASQNVLLLLMVALGLCGLFLVVVGLALTLDSISRAARGLYYRRRVWMWRLAWVAAVPTIGPLAVITRAALRSGALLQHSGGVPTRTARARRRGLGPLAGRPV